MAFSARVLSSLSPVFDSSVRILVRKTGSVSWRKRRNFQNRCGGSMDVSVLVGSKT